MAVMPNMDRDRKDRPTARPRMTSRAGGRQDSGAGERYGGDIPSPRQSYEGRSRRPSSAGGERMERERIAQLRSLLGQMQMPVPPMAGMSDMGSTVPGEGMNRPAPDINDAFFGPDRKRFDVVEFLMGLMGRR